MERFYLLVEWKEEAKKYSVVENNMVVDTEKQLLKNDLVGQVIDILWKDESAPALILQTS